MLTALIARHYGFARIRLPAVSDIPLIQRFYEYLRRHKGQSHRMADMLAHRRAPMMGGSDRAYFEGHLNGNQFEKNPWVGDFYKAMAVDAGVVTKGKVYSTQLARYPGDPRAWVSGVDDVRKRIIERGMHSEGLVKHTPSECDEGESNQWDNSTYQVSPDAVRDKIEDACANNPELAVELTNNPQMAEDLVESTTQRMSGRGD